MGLFDLQLYPCVNGQCLQYLNKLDLTNYLSTTTSASTPTTIITPQSNDNPGQQSLSIVNQKMIDWRPINSLTTNSTYDINGTSLYSSSVINGSSTNIIANNIVPTTATTTTAPSSWIPIPALGLSLRSESWVIPLLTLSSINILFILLLESLVLFRVRRKTSKPPQLFLGQTLLLALLLTSLHGFATLLLPNQLTCTLNQAGFGLGYSLIFGTLLVKTIFLISLHSGTYLPLLYQFLLLFFIMSTQIILSIQGILTSSALWDHLPKFWPFSSLSSSSSSSSPSSSTSASPSSSMLPSSSLKVETSMSLNNVTLVADPSSSTSSYHYSSKQALNLCSDLTTTDTYYYSLGYNILLVTLVSIISFRIRRHRENYREALFITISSLASILIWIVWITGSLVTHGSGPDAFIGFGLQVNTLIVFLVMFTPKAKQLIKTSWVKCVACPCKGTDVDDEIVGQYCDEDDDVMGDDCDDTMRRQLEVGVRLDDEGRGRGRGGGGGDGDGDERRRRRQRQSMVNRSGTINRNGCPVEYYGHESNQSLCAQSFVHLNPNYLSTSNSPHRLFFQHPLQHARLSHQPQSQSKKQKQLSPIYSSNNNLLHPSHGHIYSSPPPLPGRGPMDSCPSHETWNYQKSQSKSSNGRPDRFIYTNTLLKSLTDDGFAFYRMPNIPPIKPIYLNNR